jgi:hypothetical protein
MCDIAEQWQFGPAEEDSLSGVNMGIKVILTGVTGMVGEGVGVCQSSCRLSNEFMLLF